MRGLIHESPTVVVVLAVCRLQNPPSGGIHPLAITLKWHARTAARPRGHHFWNGVPPSPCVCASHKFSMPPACLGAQLRRDTFPEANYQQQKSVLPLLHSSCTCAS